MTAPNGTMPTRPKQTKSIGAFLSRPGNGITAAIVIFGAVLVIIRFTQGIGGLAALDDTNPWGLWVFFDLLCGVMLASGRYAVSFVSFYIFGIRQFGPNVRPAVIAAFCGYSLVVIALCFDVGRPWRLPYPFFVSSGTSSILFEGGICVALFLCVLSVQCAPVLFDYLGRWKRVSARIEQMAVPLTIMGLTLFTVHQSSLGALLLIAPSKVHPLWYSDFLPLFFFVSSLYAGTSLVIFEGLMVRTFHQPFADDSERLWAENLCRALAKASALLMFAYLLMRIYSLALEDNWHHLTTRYGRLFLLEIIGFVVLPIIIYSAGVRWKSFAAVRAASVLAVFGVVVNRFNVSITAFNYNLPDEMRYSPAGPEIGVSLLTLALIVLSYRVVYPRGKPLDGGRSPHLGGEAGFGKSGLPRSTEQGASGAGTATPKATEREAADQALKE